MINDQVKYLCNNDNFQKTLNMFIVIRAAEVCLELNLKNGYSFHEKTGGPVYLNEEHQAL